MPFTLKQAADAIGRSKPTVLRALQSSKISGQKDDHGEWLIEPAELFRVYEPTPDDDRRNGTPIDDATHATSNENEALRREIVLLRERVADKDEVIDDLRNRLDAESEERRRTQAQLTNLLTDQRPKAVDPEPPQPRRRWWWRRTTEAPQQ